MPTGMLSDIMGNGLDLVPHIEDLVIAYVMKQYAMAARVTVAADQKGFNPRKISQMALYNRASVLTEAQDIPSDNLVRSRKATVEPVEVGKKYALTKQRVTSDSVSNIVVEVVKALGSSIGDKVEADLIGAASRAVRNYGSSSAEFTQNQSVAVVSNFKSEARRGQLFQVIHPYQLSQVQDKLVTISGSAAGINTPAREGAIASWSMPILPNLEYVVSDFVPRRVVNKLAVYATGGTFRLAVLDGNEVGKNITAAITVSTTPATMVANVKAALEALTFEGNGTWTVSGSAINDMTVTPPTGVYFDRDSELRIAINMSAVSHTQWGVRSQYDLTTGATVGPLDINGAMKGVEIFERTASAKSFLFAPAAIMYDIRQPIEGYFEMVNSGRTGEYSATTVYGVEVIDFQQLWSIESKAWSPDALGS